jgi:hypothetical protein
VADRLVVDLNPDGTASVAAWLEGDKLPDLGTCLDLEWSLIDAVIRGCVAGRRLDGRSLGRTLFALAASRALDELHAMEADFGKKVYDNLAHLLNLEVDLPSSRLAG